MKRLGGKPLCQTPITYVDIRAFAHATEDPDKVIEAVRHLLPASHVDEIIFKRRNLKGHYGNPITLFETRVKKKEIVNAIVETLSSGLSELNKETLQRNISAHMEKGSLYIRLDKQAAFQGEFKLCTADPVRIRMRFRIKRRENIIEICRELEMLP